MNEQTKNYLKIAGIWYLVSFILSCLYIFMAILNNEAKTFEALLISISYPIVSFVCTGIVFLPAFIFLHFIFKKIINIKIRILLSSIIIIFLELIYFILAFVCDYYNDLIFWGTINIPAICIFVIVSAACTPKYLLPMKREIAITSLSIFILSIILWVAMIFYID